MAYYRKNYSNPTPRTITVRFAGPCACCGSTIKAGELATYYPAGTPAAIALKGACIAHIGGLDGNSARCAGNLQVARTAVEDRMVADYVSAGLGEF